MSNSPMKSHAQREALRVIARTCELDRANLRRVAQHPAAETMIRHLARKSAEFQRHIIERVLRGEQDPFRPTASSVLINDFATFSEVTIGLANVLRIVKK